MYIILKTRVIEGVVMSQSTITVYIPFLANVPKRGPCGGFGRLKRYIAKVFAKPDGNGAMTLGTVKKVEIIVSMQRSKMAMDDEKQFVASAFVKFVPSGTKACLRMIDEIDSDEGLKLVHNTSKLLFWNVHRQKKKNQIASGSVCPLCGHVCQTEICGKTRSREEINDVMAAFGALTCDDEPGKKRIRM